jgi:hypothetical protein
MFTFGEKKFCIKKLDLDVFFRHFSDFFLQK